VADNALHLFWADGDAVLARAPKTDLARQLIAHVAARFLAKHGNRS
jgi:phosphopantothenoylcysteine decarboxylase/phosphopantothenate--cysteine ligase